MKIKNKWLLIFIVLFGVILLNHSDCYADYEYSQEDVEKVSSMLVQLQSKSQTIFNVSLPYQLIVFEPDYGYLSGYLYSISPVGIFDKNDICYIEIGGVNKYYYTRVTYNCTDKTIFSDFSDETGAPSFEISNKYTYMKPGFFYSDLINIVLSSFDFCKNDSYIPIISDYSQVTDNIIYEANPVEKVLPNIVNTDMLQGVLSEIIGILPVIILAIVTFLAIRKAIAFLQNVLRSS